LMEFVITAVRSSIAAVIVVVIYFKSAMVAGWSAIVNNRDRINLALVPTDAGGIGVERIDKRIDERLNQKG